MTKTKQVKSLMIAACSLTVAFSSITSHAAEEGWYVGSSISAVDFDDTTLTSNEFIGTALSPRSIEIESDSDIGLGGTIGYRFKGHSLGAVRVEGEFLYSSHDVDGIDFESGPVNPPQFDQSGVNVAGDIESISLFVNVIQEFNGLFPGVRPFVGVGVGISEFYGDFQYNPVLGASVDSEDDIGLAYQFFVGIDVDITKKFTGYVSYRTVGVEEVELDRFGGGVGGIATETSQEGDVDFDAFTVGLRYSF